MSRCQRSSGVVCKRAVFAAVIDGVEPVPQALVELLERQQDFGIEVGQKLLAHGTEEAFDLAAAFGLIGRRVHDEDADGSGDARQLRRAIDLGVVHVEAGGDAAGGDGLAQAVQKRIQSLVGIELSVRDEAAGVIERGLEEDLHLAAAGALDPGAEEHVGLPDLIGELGFVLFVRGGFVEQQLAFGESAGAQETIERGGRQAGLVLLVGQGQLAQQSGAGAMWVLALEPFDESGGFRRDGAGLPAVLARLGSQRVESVCGGSAAPTPAACPPRPGGALEWGMS